MANHRLGEALIDVQTIIIVGLLYWLLREEQDNAFLRTWLSSNFPLGLYLLSPLTVVAISGTLLLITVARITLFVTGSNATLVEAVRQRLKNLRGPLRDLASTKRSGSSAIVLTGFGTVLTLYSYFIVDIVPLAALGISCIILGFTALSLPRHIGGGPGMRAMLQGATLSVEAVLEHYDIGRATYLPPVDGGAILAYVPLNSQLSTPSLSKMRRAPKSLVGNNQEGLLVYPVGSELNRIPEFQDGLSLEERLRYVLVESADICSRVMVEETGSLIVVGMKGADLDIQGQKYQNSLGSLPSSLAACVIATLHNKPVALLEEKKAGDSLIARFRLLE
ncbi:MAG TPA: hypothetical protein VKM96_06475 [Candidatus Bathyarchaeia archaeon]|nr:hypothetical protein [Candidatus Bathyarchaeia archaeon]